MASRFPRAITPAQYNGLKLFSAEGRVIPAGPGGAVLDRYQREGPIGSRTIVWAADAS